MLGTGPDAGHRPDDTISAEGLMYTAADIPGATYTWEPTSCSAIRTKKHNPTLRLEQGMYASAVTWTRFGCQGRCKFIRPAAGLL